MLTSKRSILGLCALFMFAVLLRAPGLNFHSLWHDEASTANVVTQQGYANLYETLFVFEGSPPLFYALEKAFLDIFHLTINEISLRFLPMLFGAASCVLCFLLFRRIGTTRTSYLTFALVASSSFEIYLSEEARCYALLGCMSLLTLLLSIRWWDKPEIPRSVALFIATVITTQAHYYGSLWVIAIICGTFLVKPKRRQLWRFILLMALATLLSLLPLTNLILNQIQHEVGPGIRDNLTANWAFGFLFSPIKVLIGSFLFKISTPHDISAYALTGIIPGGMLLAATFFFLVRRWMRMPVSDEEKTILLSVVFACGVHGILGQKAPTIHPRYLAHFLVLIFGMIMLAFEDKKKVQLLLFGIIIGYNGIGLFNFYNKENAYIEPWREIARAMTDNAPDSKDSCQTVVADLGICYCLALYCRDTLPAFYAVQPSGGRIQYVHCRVFGHNLYTPLYINEHPTELFPYEGTTSFDEIINNKKCGTLVFRKFTAQKYLTEIQSDYNGLAVFNLVKIFNTNQGDIGIVRWTSVKKPGGISPVD